MDVILISVLVGWRPPGAQKLTYEPQQVERGREREKERGSEFSC